MSLEMKEVGLLSQQVRRGERYESVGAHVPVVQRDLYTCSVISTTAETSQSNHSTLCLSPCLHDRITVVLLAAVIETELTRQPDSRVRGLFVDPGGTHNIINIKSNTVVETQYLHKRWQKPRTLSKLKGVVVTAVGWQKQVAAAASGAGGDDDGGGSEAGGSSSQHKGGAQSEVSGSEQQLEHTTG